MLNKKITYDMLMERIPNRYLLSVYVSKRIEKVLNKNFEEGIYIEYSQISKRVLKDLVTDRIDKSILDRI